MSTTSGSAVSRAPVGIEEIEALYGDPHPFIRDDGTVSPLWEMRMCKVDLPGWLPLGWKHSMLVKTVRVNQAIAAQVSAVFLGLSRARLWDHILTFDGGYSWRSQRGASKLSMHAYGGALDFNADENALGTRGHMDPGVVEVFEAHGWEWGGHWRRPDPMHFQFARGY
jgi:hypothetical protein